MIKKKLGLEQLRKKIFKAAISTLALLTMTNKLIAQDNQWRDQYVKWYIGPNYSIGTLSDSNLKLKENFNKFSAVLLVDVALAENDVYDSAFLYLEPFFEYSFSERNPINDNLKFSNYGAGVNLKTYFSPGKIKKNFFLLTGTKLDYIVWKLSYPKGPQNLIYTNTKLDFLAQVGVGYAINDRIEILGQYQRSFGKAYAINDLSNLKNINIFTIGLRVGLVRNWWFR